MEAPRPGGVGDAWGVSGGEDGQSEVDAGGGGRSEPGVDGGAALLLSLLPLRLLLFLLSHLSLRSVRPFLQWAGGAEG